MPLVLFFLWRGDGTDSRSEILGNISLGISGEKDGRKEELRKLKTERERNLIVYHRATNEANSLEG